MWIVLLENFNLQWMWETRLLPLHFASTVITVFTICTGKCCSRSKNQTSLQDRCDDREQCPVTDWKNSFSSINFLEMSKTYQIDTKFFEFLQYTNKDELKIKQRSQFAMTVGMASLQWLCCNGFVVLVFTSLIYLCLQKSYHISTTSYTRKYWPVMKDF